MNIPIKHKGAHAELRASAWLLSQGYEVFRNVSQHGPVDIIALNPKTLAFILIDVKTRYKYQTDASRKARPAGVSLIEYEPENDTCTLVL